MDICPKVYFLIQGCTIQSLGHINMSHEFIVAVGIIFSAFFFILFFYHFFFIFFYRKF